MKATIPTEPPPAGAITVSRLSDIDRRFTFPRLTPEVDGTFKEALESREAGDSERAEKELRDLAERFPEFLDVFYYLGLICWKRKEYDQATSYSEYAANVGLAVLPPEYATGKIQLPWSIVDNRPFYRVYMEVGLVCLQRKEFSRAVQIFEAMLHLNPNDNQGAKALAVQLHFHLQSPRDVIRICKLYPGDRMVELLFGYPLALLQLRKTDPAMKKYFLAADVYPHIAAEIIAPSHRPPEDPDAPLIKIGSEEDARLYWKLFGQFWTQTPRAIPQIRYAIVAESLGNTIRLNFGGARRSGRGVTSASRSPRLKLTQGAAKGVLNPTPGKGRNDAGREMVIELRISLQGISPPIWRRVQVPARFTLAKLHRVVQRVFFWTGLFRHEFTIANESYGPPRPKKLHQVIDERNAMLGDVLIKEEMRIFYSNFDIGECWDHDIVVERFLVPEVGVRYPRCVAGKRCSPPEDCGGAEGYAELLQILSDPKHPEHKERKQSVGGDFFDPEDFDVGFMNSELRMIR